MIQTDVSIKKSGMRDVESMRGRAVSTNFLIGCLLPMDENQTYKDNSYCQKYRQEYILQIYATMSVCNSPGGAIW